MLFVDTGEGEKLAVEVLSRGTREQLFLALRLALVDLYARRGKVMPLVLDDVLVNFDTRRTRLGRRVALRLRHRPSAGAAVHLPRAHLPPVQIAARRPAAAAGPDGRRRTMTPVRVVERDRREGGQESKEPVYVPTAMAAVPLPAMPRLDGLGVFHSSPRPAYVAPPPVTVLRRLRRRRRASRSMKTWWKRSIVEAPPQTIVHTQAGRLSGVPLWSPATPFAEASWQDAIEDDDRGDAEAASTGGALRSSHGGNGNGATNGGATNWVTATQWAAHAADSAASGSAPLLVGRDEGDEEGRPDAG